jgi:hypothetical protein
VNVTGMQMKVDQCVGIVRGILGDRDEAREIRRTFSCPAVRAMPRARSIMDWDRFETWFQSAMEAAVQAPEGRRAAGPTKQSRPST